MDRQIVSSSKAPSAIGPYSQAVRVDRFLYTSGQIGIDPQSGVLRAGIEAQTRQVLANLAAVLDAGGARMDNIVKTTIFLVDLREFATVNAIYGEAFHQAPPARSTVQVSGLPLGALVEIEAVALIDVA